MPLPTENPRNPIYSEIDVQLEGVPLSADDQHAPFSSDRVSEIVTQNSEAPRSEVLVIRPEELEGFSVSIIAEVLMELSMQVTQKLFSDRTIAQVPLMEALERINDEAFRLAK